MGENAMKSPQYEGDAHEKDRKNSLKSIAKRRHDALKEIDPKEWLLWEIMLKADEAKISVRDFREVLEMAKMSSLQHSQVMVKSFEIADWR